MQSLHTHYPLTRVYRPRFLLGKAMLLARSGCSLRSPHRSKVLDRKSWTVNFTSTPLLESLQRGHTQHNTMPTKPQILNLLVLSRESGNIILTWYAPHIPYEKPVSQPQQSTSAQASLQNFWKPWAWLRTLKTQTQREVLDLLFRTFGFRI